MRTAIKRMARPHPKVAVPRFFQQGGGVHVHHILRGGGSGQWNQGPAPLAADMQAIPGGDHQRAMLLRVHQGDGAPRPDPGFLIRQPPPALESPEPTAGHHP